MKILLVLPAGENVRVRTKRSDVLRRAMPRSSGLPLTIVAALTPVGHDVRIADENVKPLDIETNSDAVGVSFMTALALAAPKPERSSIRGEITP
jgi:hypothetical protein